MDPEGWQATVALSGLQNAPAERIDLDGPDAAVSEQFACEDAATDAGEQV